MISGHGKQNDQSNKRFDDSTVGALYPYDFLTEKDCTPEWGNLDKALKDPRITNIAISAPYDAGKTSFLLSYFTNREMNNNFKKNWLDKKTLLNDVREKIKKRKSDFRFISLPNFFLDKKGKSSEIELEYDIVSQLLFNTNSWKYPDSKLKRLKIYPTWFIFSTYLLIFIFLFCIFLLLHPNFSFLNPLAVLIIALSFVLGLMLFDLSVHYFAKANWNFSAHITGMTVNSQIIQRNDLKDVKDLFLLYGDELKYYFIKSKVRYVIFEDLDRFDQPLIFQRLRALNLNLNHGKNKIVFVYTLKDSIFDEFIAKDSHNLTGDTAATLRTKFFDYIIPLMPLSSFRNSRKRFAEEIKKYPIFKDKNDLSISYLYRLGEYISDTRVVINIVSEVAAYCEKLESEGHTYSITKLFGAVVYKNIYPNDYENIESGRSIVVKLLNNKENLRELLIKQYIKSHKNIEKVKRYSLGDLYSEISNKELNSENSKLNNIINEINKHKLLSYLIKNNYLDDSLYEYILRSSSPLNPTDQNFVRNVLAKIVPHKDIQLHNPVAVEQELKLLKIKDYAYVYSSDILTQYFVNFMSNKNLKGIPEFLRLAIQKKDYKIIYHILRKIADKNYDDSNLFIKEKELGESYNNYLLLRDFMDYVNAIWPTYFRMIGSERIDDDALENLGLDEDPYNIEINELLKDKQVGKDFEKIANFILNVLSKDDYVTKLSFLDNSRYKRLLIQRGPEFCNDLFKNRDCKFENLIFAKNHKQILNRLVSADCYAENDSNFIIIMNEVENQSYYNLLNDLDVISVNFLCNNIVNYDREYRYHRDLKIKDLFALLEFMKIHVKDKEQKHTIQDEIFNLYKFCSIEKASLTNDNKEKILNNINLIARISDNKIAVKDFYKLLIEDKLIYRKDILNVVRSRYGNTMAKRYAYTTQRDYEEELTKVFTKNIRKRK